MVGSPLAAAAEAAANLGKWERGALEGEAPREAGPARGRHHFASGETAKQ